MPANFRPEQIPSEPGVYRFFDKSDQVLYVGKAINLKNRLSSYFQSGLAERTDRMVSEAVRCDWTIVSGEVEALSLDTLGLNNLNHHITSDSETINPTHI